jgi:hypothetical protein
MVAQVKVHAGHEHLIDSVFAVPQLTCKISRLNEVDTPCTMISVNK